MEKLMEQPEEGIWKLLPRGDIAILHKVAQEHNIFLVSTSSPFRFVNLVETIPTLSSRVLGEPSALRGDVLSACGCAEFLEREVVHNI